MPISLVTVGLLMMHGAVTATLLPGLSVGLDVISFLMRCLVSVVGWVVLHNAGSHVDGEARQGAFTGWMCRTLAADFRVHLTNGLCADAVFDRRLDGWSRSTAR